MPKVGSTKYLQLPACDSDIGKPSPLALLAATCQRIGTASPPQKRRAPTPVAQRRIESPVPAAVKQQSPSPAPVKPVAPTPEVVATVVTKVPSPRLSPVAGPSPQGYQLPLTPPSTPPRVEVSPLSPRMPMVPSPVGINTPCSSTSECPCHLPSQPVLHAPSLRYSPYTMIVPSTRHLSPLGYLPCASQYGCGPVPAVVPPVFYASPYLPSALPVPSPAPFEFGTYLHHGVDTTSQFVGKIHPHSSLKHVTADAHPLGFHYSKGLVPEKHHVDEEVIDVVSV